ncbi:MAG: ATP-dependent DNA helicase [Nitrospinae bacterium]|nr:ATP-dependent DNA helicase [Nitrospinota bacterium]
MPAIDEVFSPNGGLLARHLADYEHRPEQLAMAHAVAKTLAHGGQLVVEAGTGTGKTLAYLVPAILSGLQVVVSTGVKNLQEQIFFKDIPFLRQYIGREFTAVMMKGRGNYLCPLRLKRFSQMPLLERKGEAKLFDAILGWAQTTKTGDKAELSAVPEEHPLWAQVCGNTDFCIAQKCPRGTDCFVGALRKEAEAAQVVVVNHHLFFADLALRGKGAGNVLPDYQAVVFDEAHEVEEIAAQYFGFAVSNHRLEELVRDTLRELDEAKPPNRPELIRDLDNLDTRAKNFFSRFQRHGKEERRFSLKETPPDAEAAEALLTSLAYLEEKIGKIDPLPDSTRAMAHRHFAIAADLRAILKAESDEYIFWGETRGGGVYLNASSIDVAPLLRANLYAGHTTIFTSATLAAAGDFSYFRKSLGLDAAETMALPSPFDFATQAQIYLPRLPDPASPQFTDALAEEAVKLITLVKGRTLFLFTSFRGMYEIRKRLTGRLPYTLLMQGEASRTALLERFRSEVESVLLATSSFWQGVDVKGESLSCVIIDKLPFSSPGDPVLAARIDRIKKNGGQPFTEYQLPEAVLALRQGIGRLIRHRTDRGIMMIADSRIRSKGYGKTFLKSLPPAPVADRFDALRWE